ncbi:zinc ribbon domain-containing protein [Streptomyces chartreusis]|uniref:zinc ribbon domain-containing protein n=1 Tax=Streptomyces chartreusis TaxID=1969 RepID=UPI00381FED5D
MPGQVRARRRMVGVRRDARSRAPLRGRSFHHIGRFEPTSQLCSACGVKDGRTSLYVRVEMRQKCGTVLDRDISAAVNVTKAAGLAVTAREAQVSPEPYRQRVEAGIHRDGQPTVVGISSFREESGSQLTPLSLFHPE